MFQMIGEDAGEEMWNPLFSPKEFIEENVSLVPEMQINFTAFSISIFFEIAVL